MRTTLISLGTVILFLIHLSAAVAGDFDWVRNFNDMAKSDPAEFEARLASRFQTGDTQIKAVMSEVPKASDAYIVFRLGEISKQPMDRVMAEYKFCKRKGWGAMAKRLRINPGSKEFQALKNGQDLLDRD